jgi:hypothetical protein
MAPRQSWLVFSLKKVLKNRLNKEGGESVTKRNRLKLEAADGKKYLTDVYTLLARVFLLKTKTKK